MYELCPAIRGDRHCFPIPVLIDPLHIHGPGPVNFPELELAVPVLQLVEAVQHGGQHPEFTKQLTEVAQGIIRQVQQELPQGVELVQLKGRGEAAS